jgi:hypothetical protein
MQSVLVLAFQALQCVNRNHPHCNCAAGRHVAAAVALLLEHWLAAISG